jgi:hypothetical protein
MEDYKIFLPDEHEVTDPQQPLSALIPHSFSSAFVAVPIDSSCVVRYFTSGAITRSSSSSSHWVR